MENLRLQKGIKVSEKTIMKQIAYSLTFHGWFVFRVPPSLYGQKGLCDLIAVKNGITVFIEVKTPRGKQTEDQKVFEMKLQQAGGIYILARSVDDVEWLFYTGNKEVCNARKCNN